MDPTDAEGGLLPHFKGVPSVAYCNEPQPGAEPNARLECREASLWEIPLETQGLLGDFQLGVAAGASAADAAATPAWPIVIDVVTIKEIAAGDEITIDYGEFYKRREAYAASTSIPVKDNIVGPKEAKRRKLGEAASLLRKKLKRMGSKFGGKVTDIGTFSQHEEDPLGRDYLATPAQEEDLQLQTMDIGTSSLHEEDATGRQHSAALVPPRPTDPGLCSPDEAGRMEQHLGADPTATFQSYGPGLVGAEGMAALKRAVDNARAASATPSSRDYKLNLSSAQLEQHVGANAASLVASLINNEHNQIVVRRADANAVGASESKHINFHTDASLRTLQVPLNNQGRRSGEYGGGSLVFCVRQQSPAPHSDDRVGCYGDAKLVAPQRPAGSATVHDNRIAHGVTAHTSGVRYGLFLIKTKAGAAQIGERF